MSDKLLIEILERLTKIETKIDYYQIDLKDLKDNSKWLWRGIAGTVLGFISYIMKDVIK